MRKNGWILLLVLIGVAFLVSCGKKESVSEDMGDLVRLEICEVSGEYIDRNK